MSTNTNRPLTLATTDGKTVYLSTGRRAHMQTPYPRVADLLAASARLGIAQLWVLDYPLSLDYTDPGRWDIQPTGDAPWVHAFERGTNNEVDLVFPRFERSNPWGEADTPGHLLNAIMLYNRHVGHPFRRAFGSTAKNLLLSLHQGKHALRMDRVDALPPPARMAGSPEARPYSWIRALRDAERRMRYLHAYDKNAAYLGVCSALNVGAGPAEHLTGTPTPEDMKLPGYWLVTVDETRAGIQIPAMPGRGPWWITTPTLQFLTKRGADVQVCEGWVWREHHQPLTPWYKRLRDARAALLTDDTPGAEVARAAVRATYSAFSGYLRGQGSAADPWDRSNDPLYRPDIAHNMLAEARNRLLYRADQCIAVDHMTPVAIGNIDTLYFISDEPDPYKACPSSITLDRDRRDAAHLGHFKVKGTAQLTDDLARVFNDESSKASPKVRVDHLLAAVNASQRKGQGAA